MLDRQNFLVREKVALLRMTDAYDILDPDTGSQIGLAEEVRGPFATILSMFMNKNMLTRKVEVREHPEGALVFTMRKPATFFQPKVEVLDAQGERVGYFVSKLFSIGGGFNVYDNQDRVLAEIKGKWTGWEFTFLTPEGHEMGRVTKTWAGTLKQLFTSADNYVVSIADDLADQPIAKMLLLAAALAIDIVYYDGKE
jgi:uncharacterized protein YxjI